MPPSFVAEEGGWLTIEYPASARTQVSSLFEEAHAFRDELGAALGQPVLWEARLRLARTPDELSALVPQVVAPATTAVSLPKAELIALSLEAPKGDAVDLNRALRQELATLALHEATRGQPVPRWFTVGFAEALAPSAPIGGRLSLVSATIRGKLVPVARLDLALVADAASATPQARDFVDYLRKRKAPFALLLDLLRNGEAFTTALETAYGEPTHVIERAWRDQATTRHGYLPILAMVGLVGASAFGASAWRRSRDRQHGENAGLPLEEEVDGEALSDQEAGETSASEPVRIVVRRRGRQATTLVEVDVPKIRHGGSWHTLH